MSTFNIIVIGLFLLFFVVQFSLTQTIYSKNWLILLVGCSLVIPAVLFFISRQDKRIDSVIVGLLLFYYAIILTVIRQVYRPINSFLIKRRLVAPEYENKDFTYVIWTNSWQSTDTWDRKLAAKPSWLDYVFTAGLLMLPILFIPLVKVIIGGSK